MAEAAAEAAASAEAQARGELELIKQRAAVETEAAVHELLEAQIRQREVMVTVPARAGGSEVRVRQKTPLSRARSGPVAAPPA